MKMATFKKERPEMTRRSAVGELIDRESGTCRDVFDIPGVLHFLKIIIIIIIIFCVCVCVCVQPLIFRRGGHVEKAT